MFAGSLTNTPALAAILEKLNGNSANLAKPALDQLLADRGWDRQVADHAVYAKWAHIVGNEVAAHCAPEQFADTVLTIRTDSTAWATQLRLLAPNVVARLNEVLGDGSVTRVDVVGPNAPTWRHGRRSVRGSRGPGDTYG